MAVNRSVAPNVLNATEFTFNLTEIQQQTLNNGIPLYFYNGGVQDVISVTFHFKSGDWDEDHVGIANVAINLIKNGTTNKSANEINEILDYYGASLKTSSSYDGSGIVLNCLTKHVYVLLPLIYELITEANYPASELDITKQIMIQNVKVGLQKSDFIANRKIRAVMYGTHHPYGSASSIPVIEQEFTTNNCLHYKNNYISADLCTIYVAGKFKDDVLQTISNLFGSNNWNVPTKREAKKTYTIIQDPNKKHFIENNAAGVQASLRLSMPFVKKDHPHYLQMLITNALYGGYFGSRLMSNIREDKGYTYGIYSYITDVKQAAALNIDTEVGKDVYQAAIKEIYYEMDMLRNELVEEDELQLVKNYLLGSIKGKLDGPFSIINRWFNLINNGFDKDRFNETIETYKSITPKQIQELANIYYIPDNFYEVVVI
jgi:zinc protease